MECTENLICKECGRQHSSLLHFKKSDVSSKLTDTKLSAPYVKGSAGNVASVFASGS